MGGLAAFIGMLSGSVGGYVPDVAHTNHSAQAVFAKFVSTKLGAWAAVFATATAALSSFIKQERYFELASTFSEAATNLEDQFLLAHERNFFGVGLEKENQEEWAKFVRGCENVVDQENHKWNAIMREKGPKAVNDDAQGASKELSASISTTDASHLGSLVVEP